MPLDENRGNQIHVRGEDKTACPEGESNLGVRRFYEVPRLNLDENLGNQIHVEEADKLARPPTSLLSQAHSPSYPTQAKEAAPFGVARSSTSWTSLSHDKTVDNLSARKGLGRGGSEVVDEGEEDSHQHVLITDGSQFGLPFWEAELDLLQEQFRRQFVGMRMRDIPSRRIPTADELQIQYVTWLLERPTFPLLLAPASSGFYEDVYGCSMPPRLMPTVPQPTSGTGFFDEEYIAGTRRLNRDTLSTTVNPAQRGPTSYQDVFTAQLTTLSDVHRHEKRIYQPGYTPQEIRDNIKTSLRELKPDQHLVDFQDRDIPPSHRDPQTNRVLAGLLRQRDSLDRDFQLPPKSVAADGTALNLDGQFEAEYRKRDKEYNRLNRGMYHVYAASAHIIHDRNFLSYCRPQLRNLPEHTAYKLETLKAKLRTQESGAPPYQTIQQPAPTHTQPTFSSTRPTYADVLRPPLQPRATWMKDQPPYLSDKDADETWNQSNDQMFGEGCLTDEMIQGQIKAWQNILSQRAAPNTTSHDDSVPSSGATAAWRQPIAKGLTQRVFRQGLKTKISDKNTKSTSDQSNRGNTTVFGDVEVSEDQKDCTREIRSFNNQSASSYDNISSHEVPDTVVTNKDYGHRWEDSPRRQFGNHPRARWRPPTSPPALVLAPYDKATLDRAAKWEAIHRENAKSVTAAPPKKRRTANEFGGGTFWNRPAEPKRKSRPQPEALSANDAVPCSHDLIVDTGASHVLFQMKHIDLLTEVQLSKPNSNPYAILRAANGQVLTAIGKGIFKVKTISVVAYVFRDEDLVHN